MSTPLPFAIGAALSGLAGGMIAPLSGVVPAMGVQYVAKAFITVISGGSAVVAGTLVRIDLLGTLDTGMTFLTTPVFGEVSLLIGAVLLVQSLAAGHYRPFVQGLNMTGRRAVAWILFLIAAAAVIGLFPQVFELFTVINATIYASMGILTLSLALIWGYCGIISLRSDRVFWSGRLHVRGGGDQFRGFHVGDCALAIDRADLVRRSSRVFHVLGTRYGRVSRCHYAHRVPHSL